MAKHDELQSDTNTVVDGADLPSTDRDQPASPRAGSALALAIGLAALAAVAGCKKDANDPPSRIPKVYDPTPDHCGPEEIPSEMAELILSGPQQLTFELRPDVKVTAEDNRTEIDPSQIQIHDYLGQPLLVLSTPEGTYVPIQGSDLPKNAIGKTVRFGRALQLRFLQSGSPTRTIGLKGVLIASNGKQVRIPEKDIVYTKNRDTGKVHVQFKIGDSLWFRSVADRETLENDLKTVSQPHFFVASYPPVFAPTSPRRRHYRPANSPTLMPHANRGQMGFRRAEDPNDMARPNEPSQPPAPPEPEEVDPAPLPEPSPPPEPPEPEAPETFEKLKFSLAINFSPEGVPGQISFTPPHGWEFELKTGESSTGAVEYLLILKKSQTGQTATIDITPHMTRLLTSRDSRPLNLEAAIPTIK